MTPQTAFSNCYHSHLNLTLLEVMWSSQASQKALTAIRAAAFWMGTLMCSTDVNTGASTRSGERERERAIGPSVRCQSPAFSYPREIFEIIPKGNFVFIKFHFISHIVVKKSP